MLPEGAPLNDGETATMTRQRTGALLIPEEHLEKHRRRFARFRPLNAQVLFALERDGLIVREAHPEDGRSSVVSLTARGKSLYEKAFQLHHDQLEETMAALTTDERKKLVDLLVRLGDSFADTGVRKKKRK